MHEGLNLTKVITSLSKTLDFANKAIPLYQQLKPILFNAKDLLSIANIINTPDKTDNKKVENKNLNKEIEVKKIDNQNLPTFFQ